MALVAAVLPLSWHCKCLLPLRTYVPQVSYFSPALFMQKKLQLSTGKDPWRILHFRNATKSLKRPSHPMTFLSCSFFPNSSLHRFNHRLCRPCSDVGTNLLLPRRDVLLPIHQGESSHAAQQHKAGQKNERSETCCPISGSEKTELVFLSGSSSFLRKSHVLFLNSQIKSTAAQDSVDIQKSDNS